MSSLIKLNVGSPAIYNGEKVTIIATTLVPNGMVDTGLICLIYARKESGNIIQATSEKFHPVPKGWDYEEFYPSVFLNHLS